MLPPTAGVPAPGCQPRVPEPQRVLGPRPFWSTVSCCVWGGARLSEVIRPLSPPCAACPRHIPPKARLEVAADSVPPVAPSAGLAAGLPGTWVPWFPGSPSLFCGVYRRLFTRVSGEAAQSFRLLPPGEALCPALDCCVSLRGLLLGVGGPQDPSGWDGGFLLVWHALLAGDFPGAAARGRPRERWAPGGDGARSPSGSPASCLRQSSLKPGFSLCFLTRLPDPDGAESVVARQPCPVPA